MYNRTLALLALATAASAASAQQAPHLVYKAAKPKLVVTAPSKLVASTQQLDFSSALAGRVSTAKAVLVYNQGTVDAELTSIKASGPFRASHNCASSLAPASSCQVSVAFAPTEAGPAQGALTVSGDTSSLSVALSGTGVDSLTSLSTEALVFGSALPPNVAATRTVHLTSAGKATTYGPVTVTGEGYSIVAGGSSCAPGGGTLVANATCSIVVQLLSGKEGPASGMLAVTAGGTALSASLSGTVTTPTIAFSGDNTAFKTPNNNIVVTNTVGVTTTAANTTFGIYLRPSAGIARTYTATLNGDSRISFTQTATTPNGHYSTNDVRVASGQQAVIVTSTGYPVAAMSFKADVTEPGTQVLTSTLRLTSTDGAVDMSLPVSVEFRNDLRVVSQRVGTYYYGGIDSGAVVSPGAVTDFGVMSANLMPDYAIRTAQRNFYVTVAGTRGLARGSWTLRGSKDFQVKAVLNATWSSWEDCPVTVSADKQTTSACSPRDISSNSYNHPMVMVVFEPKQMGPQTTTLTFTPETGTGLAPQTFELKGEGRFEPTVSMREGGWYYYTESAPYVPGTVPDLGSVALGQSSTKTVYASVGGNFGRMKGTWELTGSNDFKITLTEAISTSSYGSACGSVVAGGRSTTACTARMLDEGNSEKHLRVRVQFTPTSVGEQQATITFKPDPITGLAPISMPLKGTGR